MRPKEAKAGLAQPASPKTLSVCLIGCGAIGSKIAEVLCGGDKKFAGIELIGIYDPFVPHPELGQKSLQDLINLKPDLIIEAAGHAALKESLSPVLRAGIDLFILSVGALCSREVYEELENAAGGENTGMPFITTGAIGGLDIIQAAKIAGGITQASLTSIKPPKNFLVEGLPPKIQDALKKGDEVIEVFSGSVKDAALLFPQSANVCATLGFTTLGIEDTQAVLIADPNTKQVIHKISLNSRLGEYEFTFKNYPSEANPKTSAIVAYSVLRGLISKRNSSLDGGAGLSGGPGPLQIM